MTTNIHHENKSRWPGIWNTRKFIFNSGELRNEFSWKVLFGDVIGIMWREVVA
jgi:hypothetical protein